MTIQRYHIYTRFPPEPNDEDGKYCLYDDVAELEAEMEILKGKVRNLMFLLQEINNMRDWLLAADEIIRGLMEDVS